MEKRIIKLNIKLVPEPICSGIFFRAIPAVRYIFCGSAALRHKRMPLPSGLGQERFSLIFSHNCKISELKFRPPQFDL